MDKIDMIATTKGGGGRRVRRYMGGGRRVRRYMR